jgi:predicted MFS family arabinose efflux permease
MSEAFENAAALDLCGAGRITSKRSLRSLDWLSFFKADAQTTVGPYLAIFLLTARRWDLSSIGIAMSVPGAVTVLAQTPAGALVDWVARKRVLVTLSALVLAAGCLLLVTRTSPAAIILAQGVMALATIMMPPAIAAISVGLVGYDAFAQRVARNEAYSHAGAVAGAVLAGSIAYWITTIGLFYFAAIMSIAAAVATMTIREQEIDPALAREAEVIDGKLGTVSIRDLARDSRIAILAVTVILFHLANAAMLPLVGEMLSAAGPTIATSYLSACIIISQLVMTPIAVVAGRLAYSWGRKPVFLIAFAVLPIRGLLFAITTNPYLLVSIQVLDGVGAGIFGVLAVIIVSDLAQRIGRFNLMQGAMNTCVAIGSSLSNLIAGVVAEHKGYGVGFILLTVPALAALAFFWVAMPETGSRNPDYVNRR